MKIIKYKHTRGNGADKLFDFYYGATHKDFSAPFDLLFKQIDCKLFKNITTYYKVL